MSKRLTRVLFNEDTGATAVEYGLLVTIIALVMAIGAGTLGTNINALFDTMATAV